MWTAEGAPQLRAFGPSFAPIAASKGGCSQDWLAHQAAEPQTDRRVRPAAGVPT